MSATTNPAKPTVRHRPRIAKGWDAYGRTYRLVCTCGREWPAHSERTLATYDRDRHISTLPPVPQHLQCRDRRHRVPVWEVCELCASQLSLFSLDDLDGSRE